MTLRIIDPLAADLTQLRKTVAGIDDRLPRGAAMAELAASNYPGKHRDFQAILENPEEQPIYRRLAAVHLTSIGSSAAEEILRSNVTESNERVLTTVVQGLGRIGGREALRAVLQARQYLPVDLVLQADFAAELIAHRLGLAESYLPEYDHVDFLDEPGACANPMRFRRPRQREAEEVLIHLAQDPFGVELAESPMHQIYSEDGVWMLVFNREFASPERVSLVAARKTLLAVIASKINPEDDFYAALVVLTTPIQGAAGVRIRLFDPGGELFYAGSGQVEDRCFRFCIRAVQGPGVLPLRIDGSLGDSRLAIEQAISGGRVVSKLRPCPLPPLSERT